MAELIGMNEAMPEESKPASNPQDEDLVKKILKLQEYGKTARALYDRDWNYNYNFIIGGRQWGPDRPKWRFSEAVNMAWGGIMQEVGIETDSQPQTEYIGEEPSDVAFADILKEINARNWERYDWQQKFVEAKMDAKIVHVAHTESRWNPKLEGGIGDVEHVNLDPFHLYWDPSATNIDDARWIIYSPPMPTSTLKAMFPGKEITPDIEPLDILSSFSGITSTTMDLGMDSGPASTGLEDGHTGGEPMTKFVRIWIRDESVCQEEDEKDGKKEYVLKKQYPNGRYIEMVNKQILRDGPIGVDVNGQWVEYKLNGMFPIARLVNYAYPRRYAGENEVTHIKGPQKVLNYVWSYLLDVFKASINPKVILKHNAGEIAEEITNEPNQILEVPEQDSIRFEYPPGLPAGITNVVELAKNMLDTVRGAGEISSGKVPENVSSGIFFESVLEAEQIRPRMKSRNALQYLRRLGLIDLHFYLQFYRQPRVFRLTGKQDFPEYVQFSIGEDKNGQKTAEVIRFNPETGIPGQAQQIPVKGTPDVRVTVGSALPFAKAIKGQNAKELFAAGAIDREALYDMIDLPNKDAVLQRMQEQEQAMAEQAAVQGGMK